VVDSTECATWFVGDATAIELCARDQPVRQILKHTSFQSNWEACETLCGTDLEYGRWKVASDTILAPGMCSAESFPASRAENSIDSTCIGMLPRATRLPAASGVSPGTSHGETVHETLIADGEQC